MKKISVLFLAIVFLFCVLASCGQESIADNEQNIVYTDEFKYELNNDGNAYTVVGICTDDMDIVIPSEYEGVPITSIGDSAFYDCDSYYKRIYSGYNKKYRRKCIFFLRKSYKCNYIF